MAPKTRTKTQATTVPIPQSKAMAADQLHQLGNLQREHQRVSTELNDRIAELTKQAQPILENLATNIEALHTGLQTWCEANRSSLLADGGKTANLITGEVSWRFKPPSVSVRGVEDVIQQLEDKNLSKFIRTKREINKEAILNDPDAVQGIKGLTVVSGVEEFIVTPFEAQT
jgi:phage host-nuclease inhibitor protein Gam